MCRSSLWLRRAGAAAVPLRRLSYRVCIAPATRRPLRRAKLMVMIWRKAARYRPMKVSAVVALALTAAVAMAAAAEHHEISSRRAVECKNFTDAEISQGFFRTAFGA